MKQYTALKNISTSAAAIATVLLVVPAYSQDKPQPDTEGAASSAASSKATMSAEGTLPNESQNANAGAQAQDQQAAAEDVENAEAKNAAEEAQKAEGEAAQQQNEEKKIEDSLRGLTWEQRFQEVDGNDDGFAEPDEVTQAYQDELSDAGWDRNDVMSRFDRDKNGRLEETEYLFFLSALQQEMYGTNSEQQVDAEQEATEQQVNTDEGPGNQQEEQS